MTETNLINVALQSEHGWLIALALVLLPMINQYIVAWFEHRKKRKDEALNLAVSHILSTKTRSIYSSSYVDFQDRTIRAEKNFSKAESQTIHGTQEFTFSEFRTMYKDGLKSACKLLQKNIEQCVLIHKNQHKKRDINNHVQKTAEELQEMFYNEVGKSTGKNALVDRALSESVPFEFFYDLYSLIANEIKKSRSTIL